MLTLPSGKTIDPYADVIGIDDRGGVGGGYDISNEDYGLNAEDKRYLATVMIERWLKYLKEIKD